MVFIPELLKRHLSDSLYNQEFYIWGRKFKLLHLKIWIYVIFFWRKG